MADALVVGNKARWPDDLGLQETAYGFVKRLRFMEACLRSHFAGRPFAQVNVLEVGCGTGTHVCIPLARLGLNVTGIDIHTESIKYAQDASTQYPNLHFEALPLEDVATQAYDVVICSEVLEHITEYPAFFANVVRTMRPGGLLIVTVPNGHSLFEAQKWIWRHGIEASGLDQLLRRVYRRFKRQRATASSFLNKDSGHVNFFYRSQLAQLFRAHHLLLERYEGRTFLCGWMVDPLLNTPRLAAVNSKLGSNLPYWAVSDWMFALTSSAPQQQVHHGAAMDTTK